MFEIVVLVLILGCWYLSHRAFEQYDNKIAELKTVINDIYNICILYQTDTGNEDIDAMIKEILDSIDDIHLEK